MVGLGIVIQTVQLINRETVAQGNRAIVHNIQTEHQSTVCNSIDIVTGTVYIHNRLLTVII